MPEIASPAERLARAHDASIEALTVTDADGRTWCRLPLAWVENAPLCIARTTQRMDAAGARWRLVECGRQSVWVSGMHGYCAEHFGASLRFD